MLKPTKEPEQQYECLACERRYTMEHSIAAKTPPEYMIQYCSLECFNSFESLLKDRSNSALNMGLVDSDGNAISGNRVSTPNNTAQRVIDSLKFRP